MVLNATDVGAAGHLCTWLRTCTVGSERSPHHPRLPPRTPRLGYKMCKSCQLPMALASSCPCSGICPVGDHHRLIMHSLQCTCLCACRRDSLGCHSCLPNCYARLHGQSSDRCTCAGVCASASIQMYSVGPICQTPFPAPPMPLHNIDAAHFLPPSLSLQRSQ